MKYKIGDKLIRINENYYGDTFVINAMDTTHYRGEYVRKSGMTRTYTIGKDFIESNYEFELYKGRLSTRKEAIKKILE